jgi:hypothetical protein
METRHDALGQIVHHRVGGQVEQFAAVEERYDLHARRKEVIVQLLRFGVNPLQRGSESAPFLRSTIPETTSSLSMMCPSSR